MREDVRIPKKIHMIWVGDDNRKPVSCIDSWRKNHLDWQFKLWTDKDLRSTAWINEKHLRAFVEARLWPAVADLMRYEILYREGGVYVDADSFSVRPLDDWLLESEMFACWECGFSEKRDRLVSNAFLGSVRHNSFLCYVIKRIREKDQLLKRWSWSKMRFVPFAPWRSVGPLLLTRCINDYQDRGYHDITLLPSHMFCPNHYRGGLHSGKGVVYADHLWANTKRSYETLAEQKGGARLPVHAPAAVPLQRGVS
jgi:mannosyltransferase OCH1-like enzyme